MNLQEKLDLEWVLKESLMKCYMKEKNYRLVNEIEKLLEWNGRVGDQFCIVERVREGRRRNENDVVNFVRMLGCGKFQKIDNG